jgi:protein-S-isoprenylcysteine O-methyltransferase Ste14
MSASAILKSLFFAVLSGALLFVAAGTLDWPQGWFFLVLFDGCSLATGVWLGKVDPVLLAERTKSPISADQTPYDRAIVAAIMAAFPAWLAFMALDAARYCWSRMPLWAEGLGAILIVAAFWGWIGVLRANSFASSQIRLQPERGQTVICSGPYAVVRHPMYAYALLLMLGMPLLLGSKWGLAWLLLFVPLLAARILGEEAMLAQGLPGYREYKTRVRFRLVPGLW